MFNKIILSTVLVFVFSVSNSVASDLKKGWDEYRNGNYITAKKILMPLAKEGNARAQYAIGFMHQNGHGLQLDTDEADKWFRKAEPGLRKKAENGSRAAQNILSVMYRRGYGVEKDEEAAAEWNKRAARQGHMIAQYNMGWAYANGRGVPWDEKKAIKWYTKAAQKGHPSAALNLGFLYLKGDLIEKDNTKAYMWFNIVGAIGKDARTKDKDVRKRAIRAKEWLYERMMLEEVNEANHLVKEWLKKHEQ